MTDREKVEKLIALAREALLHTGEDAIESFVVTVGTYLEELESWQSEVAEKNPLGEKSAFPEEEKEALRSLVSELNEIHQQLMSRTEETKDQVSAAMGDMHRRASGMRKYIDKLPPRISITGKRKG